MPGDTLQVSAYMGKTEARNGYFDLNSGLYKVQNFNLADGILTYDNNFEPHTKGLDPNHISLTDVNIAIDTLHYLSPDISLSLRSCSFKEKSGINIEEFAGNYDGLYKNKHACHEPKNYQFKYRNASDNGLRRI